MPKPTGEALEKFVAERDRRREEWLLGDRDAIAFLMMIMQIVEAWDDIVDRDEQLNETQVNEAFTLALCALPANPFFRRHSDQFIALFMVMINAWQDANLLRDDPSRDLRNLGFHLRNMALELYCHCALLVGGYAHMRKVSPEIRRFFAFESFEDYDREVNHHG